MNIPKDTLPLRCLVQALREMMAADKDEEEARERFSACGGSSWGYHGQRLIEAREKAAEEFGKRLDEYIDVRIRANSTTGDT